MMKIKRRVIIATSTAFFGSLASIAPSIAWQGIDPRTPLEGYANLACAPNMEASELTPEGNNLFRYTCTFSSGFGCIKGQNCPPIKCRPNSYKSDWKKLDALDEPSPPDGELVQAYICLTSGR